MNKYRTIVFTFPRRSVWLDVCSKVDDKVCTKADYTEDRTHSRVIRLINEVLDA